MCGFEQRPLRQATTLPVVHEDLASRIILIVAAPCEHRDRRWLRLMVIELKRLKKSNGELPYIDGGGNQCRS